MLTALALAALLMSGGAPRTVGEWKRETDPTERNFDKLEITGIGEGMISLEVEIEETGGKPIFCAPPKLPISGKLTASILEAYTKEHPELDRFSFGTVMVEALKDAFPCKP